MFLAAVLAHHTEDALIAHTDVQALPEPAHTETPIRQSVREQSQGTDIAPPSDRH